MLRLREIRETGLEGFYAMGLEGPYGGSLSGPQLNLSTIKSDS
jgi:hypothetical protein